MPIQPAPVRSDTAPTADAQEHLVVLQARLAFAMPVDAPLDSVYDTANCMLIPLQRCEGGTCGLIDYAFDGVPAISITKVEGYDRDAGFADPHG